MERIDLDAVIREPDQGHTSKGDQPKWQWKGKWYKADYMGYEALSEVLISRLLKRSNVSGFAEYGPVRIRYQGRELPGCVSDNFRDKDEILVPLERAASSLHGVGGTGGDAWQNEGTEGKNSLYGRFHGAGQPG